MFINQKYGTVPLFMARAFCQYPSGMKKTDTPLAAEADKFIVRLPQGMRERIAESARANKRSMNAEVVLRLQASFEKGTPALDVDTLATKIAEQLGQLLRGKSED
jgi:hypothetical protein